MKFQKSLFLLLFFTIIPFMSSCTADIGDPISVDDDYVNNQILLRAADYANSYRTSDSIALELKYNSNNEIVFPRDYNLKIFAKKDDNWMEVKEEPTERYPSDNIIFSHEREMPIVQVIFLYPDLPDPNQKYSLRIYVSGEMKEKGEIKEVYAFTEIRLAP